MNRREHEDQPRELSALLGPVMDDDAFLTALSRGENTRDDELGELFLALRADVERPMPSAPLVGEPGEHEESSEPAGAESNVASLDSARSRRRVSPWAAALLGAAASTVAVVGSGAALYGATPGSPLWGASTAVFGDRAAVVELAGTLEDLDAANKSGDADGARKLLEQARLLVNSIQNPSKDEHHPTPQTTTSVATESVTVSPDRPEPAPAAPVEPVPAEAPSVATATETETATVTSVVTVTVTAPSRPPVSSPAPTSTRSAEPAPVPTGPDAFVDPLATANAPAEGVAEGS
ncbi:hypothetical protein [Corynebacterium sp.]|uniref:hypothetical protein n=1 Tax=Corynebacterium sp. TaxID=1720 RepID=UPI002A90A90F|nr:hypothetical protein [Corynebacterium sp.]MDY5784568.1 hypothetical protein [Corynebacterium sp.]